MTRISISSISNSCCVDDFRGTSSSISDVGSRRRTPPGSDPAGRAGLAGGLRRNALASHAVA